MNNLIYSFFVVAILCPFLSSAQTDSLILNNGNFIVGEIKSMDRGILQMETPYSDSDFKIEWDGIMEIYSESYFLITLEDGTRLNGTINSTSDGKAIIKTEKETKTVNLVDIVYANSLKRSFWSKIYATIDLGYSLTKANNLTQFTVRSTVGYLSDRWGWDASYNDLKSTQDNVADVNRTDGAIGARYFLPKDWFFTTKVSFLTNTEQSLKLRATVNGGIGKFVIHTNSVYWNFSVGANYNDESFNAVFDSDGMLTTPASTRTSMEGFLGTQFNMFDVGDLGLLTTLMAYPSFTESGRWRTDFSFDAKYDLPLEFYIKYGITVNYDNRPVEAGKEIDYISQLTFGWEL